MEEGGGNSFDEIDGRLNIWNKTERKTFEDLVGGFKDLMQRER